MGISKTQLKHHLQEMANYNVLVTILTDGEENNPCIGFDKNN
jgi:hypothetical protein